MSIIGLGVALALFILGAIFRAPVIIGLFASIPFGSTAFATIGGSSPLIYTLFILLLAATILIRKSFLRELGMVFARHRSAWLLAALAIYTTGGSFLLPRLFASKTFAYVPSEGVIVRVPLGPTPGNLTQTAYFLLGIFTFYAITILLLRTDKLDKIRIGLFTFVITNTLLGLMDLAAKFVGIGDIFAPIRTASYALLTDVEQSGFFRIVGACPEASAYAALSLSCLAFAYTYWRRTGSTMAQGLTAAILLLLVLSTSSTAYGGLGVLTGTAAISLAYGATQGRLRRQDWFLLAALLAGVAAILAAILYNEALLRPFNDLFRTMVLEKGSSASALERGEWNAQGLRGFFDTYGLGLGLGSSRTSSWIVSAISQFGVIGMALIFVSIAVLVRGMGGVAVSAEDKPIVALCAGARACGLASLAAACISGGTADPGILFFICLATVVSCRASVRDRHLKAQFRRREARRALGALR